MSKKTRYRSLPMDPATAALVEPFQKAARTLLRKMFDNPKFAYLLIGTQTYEELLEAYAKSVGATLPENASLVSADQVWDCMVVEAVPEGGS